MVDSAPTFGQVLRAFRHGYGISGKYGCFVRIGADGPPFQIAVHPFGLIKETPGRGSGLAKRYVAWWDHEDMLDLVEGLPIAPARAEVFYADELGRRVK